MRHASRVSQLTCNEWSCMCDHTEPCSCRPELYLLPVAIHWTSRLENDACHPPPRSHILLDKSRSRRQCRRASARFNRPHETKENTLIDLKNHFHPKEQILMHVLRVPSTTARVVRKFPTGSEIPSKTSVPQSHSERFSTVSDRRRKCSVSSNGYHMEGKDNRRTLVVFLQRMLLLTLRRGSLV